MLTIRDYYYIINRLDLQLLLLLSYSRHSQIVVQRDNRIQPHHLAYSTENSRPSSHEQVKVQVQVQEQDTTYYEDEDEDILS